jgi:hypothetical protein
MRVLLLAASMAVLVQGAAAGNYHVPNELSGAGRERPEALLKGEPWPPTTVAHVLYAMEHGMYDPNAPGEPAWWPRGLSPEELRARLLEMVRECSESTPIFPAIREHEWCP